MLTPKKFLVCLAVCLSGANWPGHSAAMKLAGETMNGSVSLVTSVREVHDPIDERPLGTTSGTEASLSMDLEIIHQKIDSLKELIKSNGDTNSKASKLADNLNEIHLSLKRPQGAMGQPPTTSVNELHRPTSETTGEKQLFHSSPTGLCLQGPSPFESNWVMVEKALIQPNKKSQLSNSARLMILETMFTIGDYVTKYNLKPLDLLKDNALFQPDFLAESLKLSILQIKRQTHRADILLWLRGDAIVPTLACLTTHPKLNPFHRSIAALDQEDKRVLVQNQLEAMMKELDSKEIKHLGRVSKPFEDFTTNLNPFFARGIKQNENQSTIDAVKYAGNFFKNPPIISQGSNPTFSENENIEKTKFLFSGYILNYCKNFKPELIEKINGEEKEQTLKKISFMDSFQKIFQRDPSDSKSWDKEKLEFGQILNEQSENMKNWMKRASVAILSYRNLDLFMGKEFIPK